MDEFGDIAYVLFFAFLLIVNATAAANKKRRKQQQQQQREREQQPPPESGERTKSLEEVMREIFGETTPKPQPPQPRRPEQTAPVGEATTRRRTTSEEIEAREMAEIQEKFSNPLQEVMARVTDPKAMERRKADQEQLARIFAQKPKREEHKRRYRIDPEKAVLYSEILMKPRWQEY
jgi:hypothetical protein